MKPRLQIVFYELASFYMKLEDLPSIHAHSYVAMAMNYDTFGSDRFQFEFTHNIDEAQFHAARRETFTMKGLVLSSTIVAVPVCRNVDGKLVAYQLLQQSMHQIPVHFLQKTRGRTM